MKRRTRRGRPAPNEETKGLRVTSYIVEETIFRKGILTGRSGMLEVWREAEKLVTKDGGKNKKGKKATKRLPSGSETCENLRAAP